MGIENMNTFVEQFNKEFGSKIKIDLKDTPLIFNIFNEYIEQTFKTSDLYLEIINKILEIEDEFKNSLTEEQEKLFDKWETYKDEIASYMSKRSFIYGFCCDKQLNIEKNAMNNKLFLYCTIWN